MSSALSGAGGGGRSTPPRNLPEPSVRRITPQEEINELEGIIDETIKLMYDVMASGEILTDEFQLAIAQELGAANDRIDFLRQQMAPTAPSAGEPAPSTSGTSPISPTPTTPSRQPPLPPFPAVDDEIEPAPINSSNIYGFAYDPKKESLLVKFQGNGDYGEGPVYSYQGVPFNVFRIFQAGAAQARTTGRNQWGEWWVGKTPSLGAAMNQYIKSGKFPYERLE